MQSSMEKSKEKPWNKQEYLKEKHGKQNMNNMGKTRK
jgi:hypothetical protein